MSRVGLVKSSNMREGFAGLYDHLLGLLKEKASVIDSIYGRTSAITPFYTASFTKDYNRIPAVSMSIAGNRQIETGIGRMAGGASFGEQLGTHNFTHVEFDCWARNRLELETIANAVLDTFQRYKHTLQKKGILNMVFFRSHERLYDPNVQHIWGGAVQASGEIWSKVLEFTVRWDYVWMPIDPMYDIKKIEVYGKDDGVYLIQEEIGLIILGLLDSMYLTRHLGKGIKVIRTGGRY